MIHAARRYLLRPDIDVWLYDRHPSRVKYRCYFTEIALCKEVEYCRKGKKYYKITREGIGEKLQSRVEKIDDKMFKKEKTDLIGEEIRKNRYRLRLSGRPITIDHYKRPLKGVNILELPDTKPVPKEIRPFLLREITHDPRYLEKHLALFGDPSDTSYNIYTLFRKIEQTLPKQFDRLLFPQMRTIDAVRIVLYGYYQQMLAYKNAFLESGEKADFERFHTYTGRSLALLRHFPKLFEKSFYQKALLHLAHLRDITTPLRDLYQIQKQLTASKKLFGAKEYFEFQKRLEERIAQIRHDLSHFFKTRECAIILKQYEMMLKEGTQSRFRDDNSSAVSHIVAKKLEREMEKISRLAGEIDGCQDEVSYRRLRKALKKADILLLAFKNLLEPKWQILHQRLHALLQKLKSYENLSRKSMIVATYVAHTSMPAKKQKSVIDRTYTKNARRELVLSKEIDTDLKRLLDLYQQES